MSPNLQAAADALIYDVGMLLHVSSCFDEAQLERPSPATGWTVRQTLGHLAASYERYAGALQRRVAGEYAPWPNIPSSETLAKESETPIPAIEERMRTARREIVASLAVITPGQESAPLAEGFPVLLEVVEAWSRHGAGHAIDFVETVPELADDPLILGWVFHPRAGEDTSLPQRRSALLERLRDRPRGDS